MSPWRVTFAVFIVFQVFDGLVTYSTVSIFGTAAEGNPLLATWIDLAGPGPALIGAKLVSCACGTVLYFLGINKALAALTVLYMFAAVLPWLHFLSAQ